MQRVGPTPACDQRRRGRLLQSQLRLLRQYSTAYKSGAHSREFRLGSQVVDRSNMDPSRNTENLNQSERHWAVRAFHSAGGSGCCPAHMTYTTMPNTSRKPRGTKMIGDWLNAKTVTRDQLAQQARPVSIVRVSRPGWGSSYCWVRAMIVERMCDNFIEETGGHALCKAVEGARYLDRQAVAA